MDAPRVAVSEGWLTPPFWIILFIDSPKVALVQRFLKRGFRHCLAIAPVGDKWLALDPAIFRFQAGLMDQATLLHWLATHPGKPLMVKVPVGAACKVRWRALPTCVSFVKHLLGLSAWALTPWQLYRELVKRGLAKVIV